MLVGLVTRRECWILTWCGRLALAALLMAACWFAVIEVHPFLAMTDRMPARVLVIEGLVGPITMKEAAEEFRVATQWPYARRSRLLYQKAFGDSYMVGIIALRNLEYDPAHWWRTSEGGREVIGESIVYLYARFFFNLLGQIPRSLLRLLQHM